MTVDQIRGALDTIDATPRAGFLAELEAQWVAAWRDGTDTVVTGLPGAGLPIAEFDVELDVGPGGSDVAGGERPGRSPATRSWMLMAAAVIGVLAVGVVAMVAGRDRDTVRTDPGPPAPSTAPLDSAPATLPDTTVGDGPLAAFAGDWVSTDTDGSAQTMTIEPIGPDAARMTVHDDVASVACAGAAATLSGTGELDGSGSRLVVAITELACADGSEPAVAAEDLGAYGLTYDGESGTLTDAAGVVWRRAGAEVSGTPSATPESSGGMWPQTSADEVLRAQELADAGDPASTWQLEPLLLGSEWWEYLRQPGADIVERFLREELGWEEFLFNPFAGDDGDGAGDGTIRVGFLRCATGETNTLYPHAAQGDARGADACAPTIDELRYEAVTLDLTQPARRGADGIWVVNRWSSAAPFAQADPRAAEAAATARLESFLDARVVGEGAEGAVEVTGLTDLDEAPLLYATSAGAPYDRFEIERTSGPLWPDGDMEFEGRLFADGGDTVVAQRYSWRVGSLALAERSTTENGRPLAAPYSFFDGEVTAAAPAPWKHAFERRAALVLEDGSLFDRNIELVADPYPVATGCERGPAPADAAALAASIQADPDLVTTAPVPVGVAGLSGLMLDVTVASGASVCASREATLVMTPGPDAGAEPRYEGELERGSRMRLYLLDHPAGSPATRILAIAVVATEARFETMIEAAAPIVASIELHPT